MFRVKTVAAAGLGALLAFTKAYFKLTGKICLLGFGRHPTQANSHSLILHTLNPQISRLVARNSKKIVVFFRWFSKMSRTHDGEPIDSHRNSLPSNELRLASRLKRHHHPTGLGWHAAGVPTPAALPFPTTKEFSGSAELTPFLILLTSPRRTCESCRRRPGCKVRPLGPRRTRRC